MSRRGPKPQPTNLRLLQGGSSRSVNEPEPARPVEIPEPPVYLAGYAKQEWDRIIADLYGTGTYRNVDQTMLAAYCMAFSRWVRAELDLEKMAELDPTTHGVMIKTTNGNAIQNPLVGVASTARRDMQRLAAEFGLTPSSRTQIDTGRHGDTDAIAAKYGL